MVLTDGRCGQCAFVGPIGWRKVRLSSGGCGDCEGFVCCLMIRFRQTNQQTTKKANNNTRCFIFGVVSVRSRVAIVSMVPKASEATVE